MTSEARVAANRRNAAKSTGPRTAEGKAIVAQNAVKHGLWARQAVLRDEDRRNSSCTAARMLQKLDRRAGGRGDGGTHRGLVVAAQTGRTMQDEALDYLIEADRGGLGQVPREDGDPSARAELAFGRGSHATSPRQDPRPAEMHERRIESSCTDDEGTAQVRRSKKGRRARGIEFSQSEGIEGGSGRRSLRSVPMVLGAS